MDPRFINRTAGALILLGAAATAHAGDWDWDEQYDHWRPATKTWASQIHPEHPSGMELEQQYLPPPDEPWCHEPGIVTQADCSTFYQIHDNWVRDFLALVPGAPIPGNLEPYPNECPSVCFLP